MTEDTVLDTTISEPSMMPDEVEMLLFALERSRAQFAWKCGGLDAAALSKPHPPSAMTLGGLLKHMALNEDWKTVQITGQRMIEPWTTVDWDAEPEWPWHSAADDPPEELYRLWREAAERSRKAVAALLADGGLDQPAKLPVESGETPNVRRFLVDLHDEYARHVGHADLFREAVDGLVGEDPPQP
ncbi:MAG: hypothetical protein QOD31_3892 [Pseudonocardiales bacterium]|nr:hypothetical protein [Pseudonocardiales bacterium]